jgi:hypothetical protein
MHENMQPNAGRGKTAATWCQAGSVGRETESWLVKKSTSHSPGNVESLRPTHKGKVETLRPANQECGNPTSH